MSTDIKPGRHAADATPAPLDPSKVHAGDTVTLEDRRNGTHDSSITPDPDWRLTGRVREVHVTHSRDGAPYAWNVRIGHTPYQMGMADWTYTLTAHQPAPEPALEWGPGTAGTASVSGYVTRVMRTDGVGGADAFWVTPEIINGRREHEASKVTGFVPDGPAQTVSRDQIAEAIMTADTTTTGNYGLHPDVAKVAADAVLALLAGERS